MKEEHLIRLVQRCVKNDRRSQKELYELFFPTMFITCKRYLKNDEDAFEIVNTGMLTVFTKIEDYGNKGSFEGWVRRIMVNKCLDLLRQKRRQPTSLSTTNEEHLLHSVSVENEVIERIENAQLKAYLNELPDLPRLVFNLYAIDGYSHEEIAARLDLKSGTSRWYLSKARTLLKEKIECDALKMLNHER